MAEPQRPRRFPEASRGDRVLTPRIQSAGIRALHDYTEISRLARAVTEEIKESTAPHGIPVTDLSDEDSMVKSVKSMIPNERAASEHDS